jgi:putative DNA primase/helicase
MSASSVEWVPEPVKNASESPRSQPDLLHFPFTETGNAERLVALYGRDLRFCSEVKKWLVWDGRRWSLDNSRRPKVLAKRTMRLLYAQAADIENRDFREAAEKHARKSESAAGINAMLTCAEYEEGIPVSAAELDTHPLALNLWNGTLDLQCDILHPHRREDLITRLVHFEYWPEADCPQFMRFLHRVMGDGPDASAQDRNRADRLASYLQKCFGYALTADVSEKAVFCFFDAATRRSGNNGKTTLLETIRFVLPEYSAQVLIDSLMMHQSRESNASLADQADLRGARFVTTSEAEEGQRLAVGKLKYLTAGMGEIKSCRKYENPISFTATHKLFIDANHRPVIRGTEKAVWNRLKPVPFIVTIPREEIDTALPAKLRGEAEGILAWMVQGCRRWIKEGLGDPPEVAEASAEWQAESDRLPAFIQEKCLLSPDAWLPVAHLWPAYQNWCDENNERVGMTKAIFDEKLEKMGLRRAKNPKGDTRAWIGINIRKAHEEGQNNESSDNRTPSDTKC